MAGLPPTIADASVSLTWGGAGVYYGYCTIADVGYEFPDKVNFASLTNSIIAQEITNSAQEMQNALARMYQMPYAGTDGGILLTLRQVNAKLATANILDRFYQGSEPTDSSAAAERRSWAELILTDVLNGQIQWQTPFGDAVPLAEKPVYPSSAGATIYPDPATVGDPLEASPIFVMGRTRYRQGGVL